MSMDWIPRPVVRTVEAEPAMDGAGVRIRRVFPTASFADVDPFVLLDEIRSDDPTAYIAGFPPHPHRGIETVTYMLAGRMRHKDSNGNEGVIGAGDVQWMTAGRGIIHSEMPEQRDGLMWGFQLWVNLPGAEKMSTRSAYEELSAGSIPTISQSGTTIRVIAGQYGGQDGPAPPRTTRPLYLDVQLAAGSETRIQIEPEHQAFAYVIDGAVTFTDAVDVAAGNAVIFGEGSGVQLSARRGGRVLLFAGRPNREPIVRYGPFVMTSEDDLRQAFLDFRSGRFLDPAA